MPPGPAYRSMRPSYLPHAVLSRSILRLSFVILSQHLSRTNLSARRSAPGVALSTNVGHQGSMMIPLVPVIVSQNAYILYIRALRFGDPVQGTAACGYERQAAQSRRCSSPAAAGCSLQRSAGPFAYRSRGLLCLLCAGSSKFQNNRLFTLSRILR